MSEENTINPQIPVVNPPLRKSTISKSIEIKIQTGQYTNITFKSSAIEEVEWTTIADRAARDKDIFNFNLAMLNRDIEEGLKNFNLTKFNKQ